MGTLDFSSFLLSCSPPKFDLSLLTSSLSLRNPLLSHPSSNDNNFVCQEKFNDEDDEVKPLQLAINDGHVDPDDSDDEDILAYIHAFKETESAEKRSERIKAWELNYADVVVAEDFKMKKVSFADESNLRLDEEVQFFYFPGAEVLETLVENAEDGSISDGESLYSFNFNLPLCRKDFMSKLSMENICLERINISKDSLFGVICVSDDVSQSKPVTVRCTYDNWQTFTDISATYAGKRNLPMSWNVSDIEVYEFELFLSRSLLSDKQQKLMFAIRLEKKCGEEFWDNNNSENYAVKLKS